MEWMILGNPLVILGVGVAAAIAAGVVALIGRRFRGRAMRFTHLALSAVAVFGICIALPLWVVTAGAVEIVTGILAGASVVSVISAATVVSLMLVLSLVPVIFIIVPLVEHLAYQQQRFDPSCSESGRFHRSYGI